MVTIDGVANDGATAESGQRQDRRREPHRRLRQDSLTGSGGPNVIRGGAGNDTIAGGSGDDDEYGDDGNDTFAEGAAANGADDFFGGCRQWRGDDRRPRRLQPARDEPSASTIDDAADDGASGETDNVHADVESARGGSRQRRL